MLNELRTIDKSFYISDTYRWWTVVEDKDPGFIRLCLVSRKLPSRSLRPTPSDWGNALADSAKWFCIYDPRYGSETFNNSEYYSREGIPTWITPLVINWYKSPFIKTMQLREFIAKTSPEGSWNVRLSSPIL